MRDVEDLITDIASIVSSCKFGERMTLSRIEEDYRGIYGGPIPYHKFGYTCLEKLLGNFPKYFSFSEAEGCLLVHTASKHLNDNITEMIKNNNAKSKNCSFNSSTSLFKKHRRKEMKLDPELPVSVVKQILRMMDEEKSSLQKSEFFEKFLEFSGFEIKYNDYGFMNEDQLFRYLGDVALIVRNNRLYQRTEERRSLYDLVVDIVRQSTGFTPSILQDRLVELAHDSLSFLMRREGMVNFVELIYASCHKKIVCYDFQLVYPFPSADQRSILDERSDDDPVTGLGSGLYPPGVNHIHIHAVSSPSKFFFEIIDNEAFYSRQQLHDELQVAVDAAPLLINFKENRICCVEYDGVWYRVRIAEICSDRGNESVRVHFMDHPIQVGCGVRISLPTDRLRFVPFPLRFAPAFFHRGCLAYVRPVADNTRWSKEATDLFLSLTLDRDRRLEAFLTCQSPSSGAVTIDILSRSLCMDPPAQTVSLHHALLDADLADLLPSLITSAVAAH